LTRAEEDREDDEQGVQGETAPKLRLHADALPIAGNEEHAFEDEEDAEEGLSALHPSLRCEERRRKAE
jgi:hypothetical protein